MNCICMTIDNTSILLTDYTKFYRLLNLCLKNDILEYNISTFINIQYTIKILYCSK